MNRLKKVRTQIRREPSHTMGMQYSFNQWTAPAFLMVEMCG